MYSLVLFDMDDTIFDFEKAEKEAFEKTFRTFGLENLINSHPVFKKINLSLWRKLEKGEISAKRLRVERFESFLSTLKITNIDANTVAERYISFLKEGTHLVENAKFVLNSIKKKRNVMAIITNGIADVQNHRLQKSGLLSYFNGIYISEEIGFSKPDPRFFIHVIKQFKSIKKSNVVVVGDNISSDIQGAHICGLDSVWFNPKNKENKSEIKPTYEIDSLEELLKIL